MATGQRYGTCNTLTRHNRATISASERNAQIMASPLAVSALRKLCRQCANSAVVSWNQHNAITRTRRSVQRAISAIPHGRSAKDANSPQAVGAAHQLCHRITQPRDYYNKTRNIATHITSNTQSALAQSISPNRLLTIGNVIPRSCSVIPRTANVNKLPHSTAALITTFHPEPTSG